MITEEIDDVIDESIELLYGTSTEKLAAASKVAYLCADLRFLEKVANQSQIISAFARLLGENSNVELSFVIGKVFLAMSLVQEFHQILSSHSVGATILKIIELELEVERSASFSIAEQGEGSFSTRQEHFLFICLSILSNLADNHATLRKMVKKGLVPLVIGCLRMKSAKAVVVSLSLLKLSSIFEETAVEITNNGHNLIPKLVNLLHLPCADAQVYIIKILFNLSFLEENLHLISNEEIHSFLVMNSHKEHLNPHLICLMYHLSSSDENRKKFFNAGISEYLIGSIKTAKKQGIDESLAGLLVNMTLHPLCAEHFVKNGVASIVFSVIRDESSLHFTAQVLLKVVRNMSMWSRSLQCKIYQSFGANALTFLSGHVEDPASYIDVTQQSSLYWEKKNWCAHVSFLWNYLFQCKNDDVIVELVGILNNLTVDDLSAGNQWHDILEEHSADMLQFLKRVFDSNDGSAVPCCDDLKLEVIIWLGELCTDKESSCWFVSMNILDDINRIFTQSFVRRQDTEMGVEILFLYEQLLLHEETSLQVFGGDGVVDAMLCCLEEGYALRTAALKCLVLIEELDRDRDGSLGEVILAKRFELLALVTDDGEYL